MLYKIHDEPRYIHECKSILNNIVNQTTIKNEMERIIEKHGLQPKRASVEKLFQKSIKLEKYFNNNISLNLPGYEETGQQMAEFLFKSFKSIEGDDLKPFDVIEAYDAVRLVGVDNKALIILINLRILKDEWEEREKGMDTPPPSIDDSQFFRLINNSHLELEEKLDMLKLYFDFSTYRAYAHALLQRTEELLKNKIHEYADEIKTHMNFIEQHLLANNTIFSKNQIDIGAKDDQFYHVYPGIYHAHAQSLSWIPQIFSPASVIIGINVFQLEKLSANVESANTKTTQFLNCLSDSTKQTILKLLKEESLYGSQLAKKLNCTGANISQHMSILLDLGVVHTKKENNRLYYHLKKDIIHKYLEAAKGLFG